MLTNFVDDVAKFLFAVESTQDELATLFLQKRAALVAARAPELVRIAEAEQALTVRLQSHLRARAILLQRAAAAGIPANSIESVVRSIDSASRPQLQAQVNRTKESSERLRRAGWVHWIVAQRTLRQCGELLDLIANHGRKALTYGAGKVVESTSGGALLDASA